MRLLLILLLTLNLLQAKKIALLIGNSDYNFAPLANPLNDVDGIKNTLLEIGFSKSDITVLRNSSKSEMENALLNFEEKAQFAEIALVYFSGHGMQVNNVNYMFPARTKVTKPIHLKKLVDLEMFIQSASSAKYGIILVDACRNNPLVKYFQSGRHKGDSAKKGLGQVTPKSGQVVIGFATSAGDTADDGNGDMSPYAKALSKRLKTPNKDITKVLGLVALDIQKKYEQNPIIRTNLAYDVFLNRKIKWIKPTDNTCKNYGGKIDKNGVCKANWYRAKKICNASGGNLPSEYDLGQIIINCGGVNGVAPRDNINRDNRDYQSCYKEKGFHKDRGYWTLNDKSPFKQKYPKASTVTFFAGLHFWNLKAIPDYVVCVQ